MLTSSHLSKHEKMNGELRMLLKRHLCSAEAKPALAKPVKTLSTTRVMKKLSSRTHPLLQPPHTPNMITHNSERDRLLASS